MSSVSGNTPRNNPDPIKGYALLLRAASVPINATALLYAASRRLEEPTSPANRAVNKSVCNLVATMLDLEEAEPELVEHVLRNLP